MHLLIDGTARNSVLLTDEQALKDWMVEVAGIAKMHVFGEPISHDYPYPLKLPLEGHGISAVVFLGESSITVHIYPEWSQVFIDIFSCKDFETPEYIREWVERTMEMEDISAFLFQRGVDLLTGKPQKTQLLRHHWRR